MPVPLPLICPSLGPPDPLRGHIWGGGTHMVGLVMIRFSSVQNKTMISIIFFNFFAQFLSHLGHPLQAKNGFLSHFDANVMFYAIAVKYEHLVSFFFFLCNKGYRIKRGFAWQS